MDIFKDLCVSWDIRRQLRCYMKLDEEVVCVGDGFRQCDYFQLLMVNRSTCDQVDGMLHAGSSHQ